MALNPNFNPNAPHRHFITSSDYTKIKPAVVIGDELTKEVPVGKEAFNMLFDSSWQLKEAGTKIFTFVRKLI